MSAFHSVAAAVLLNKARRITIRKCYDLQFPYYFVAIRSRTDGEQRLLICTSPRLLATLRAECAEYGYEFHLMSSHRTRRPTLSVEMCEQFSLVPGAFLWMLGDVGVAAEDRRYGEIFSEAAWSELQILSLQHPAFLAEGLSSAGCSEE